MNLVFDIGGTNMRMATSPDGSSLENIEIVATPKLFDQAMISFGQIYTKLSQFGTINSVSGGVAGAFDKEKRVLLRSPHLSDWENKPLAESIVKIVGQKVALENDSAIVGLGEAKYGAGKGHEIVVYITVSTGVGGVRIVKGAIDTKSVGFEPGHQIINASSGSEIQYLEDLISGSGIINILGKSPEEVNDPKFWDEVSYYLAIGLNNSIVHWSPDVVVLGGKVMQHIDLDKVRNNLSKICRIFPNLPEIKKSELGDMGGLYGALGYSSFATGAGL